MKMVINQDIYQGLSEAMNNNYIASHCSFSMSKINIVPNKISELVKYFEDTFDAKIYAFDKNSTQGITYIDFYLGDGERCILAVEKSKRYISLEIFATSIQEAKVVFDLITPFKKTEAEATVNFMSVYMESGQINTNTSQLTLEDFEDEKDFYYPYLKTDILFEKFMKSDESILLLAGLPGIGKTKLIKLFLKRILENPELAIENGVPADTIDDCFDFNVVYVKNEEVLAQDGFWNMLSADKYSFVILDDADHCLTKREVNKLGGQEDQNKNKFLSQLLSYTDGMLDSETKFIITTNKPVQDIDTAVLRKGRTFDILQLRPLKYDEAKEVWCKEGETVDTFVKFFDDPTQFVFPSDIGSNLTMLRNMDDADNALAPYVTEDGISIIKHVNKVKKVGFL